MTSVSETDPTRRPYIAGPDSKSETPLERIARLEQENERLRREVDAARERACETEATLRDTLQLMCSIAGVVSARWATPEARSLAKELRARLNAITAVFVQPGSRTGHGLIDISAAFQRLAKEAHAAFCRPSGVGVRVEVPETYVSGRVAISLALIVTELVINACQHAFSDRSFGSIEIVIDRVDKATGRLVVADNGAGLPPLLQANWPHALKDRPNAGLATALALARSIGGELAIESGAGTKFVATFPHRA